MIRRFVVQCFAQRFADDRQPGSGRRIRSGLADHGTAGGVLSERPAVPILALTPNLATARRLALLWGAHCVHLPDIRNFNDMVQKAVRTAYREEIAGSGERVVITAGVPFGTPGSTNVLRIAWIDR